MSGVIAASLRRAGPLVVAAMLVPTAALAATTIENTARASYTLAGSHQRATMASNTVVTEVLPAPTAATLAFRRYDPGATDGSGVPLDGGECRVADGGFQPVPPLFGADGEPLDTADAPTTDTEGYYAGEPVVITIRDFNRNVHPDAREYVSVEVVTSTGDVETLHLRETGPDTGIFAGGIQSVPMPPEATRYDCRLSLAANAKITARYTDTDFPLDAFAVSALGHAVLPSDRAVLRLVQTVSRETVEIGDFVQYTLVLTNIHDAAANGAWISNTLPPGVRYMAGSLRVGTPSSPPGNTIQGQAWGRGGSGGPTAVGTAPAAVEPETGRDGRTFTFPVSDLAPGSSVTATFVAGIGSGAGETILVNRAVARASRSLASNWTETFLRRRESLATSRFTIVGRVVEGDCGGADAAVGVAGVRLFLEDGTYVATDATGAYHFEAVRPGTHVVQLDTITLPPGLVAVPCTQDTRLAGRGHSRFVEGQGGSLLRADFHLQTDPSAARHPGEAGTTGDSVASDGHAEVASDVEAGGGDTDWFKDQVPGRDWLFPAVDYNPRVPSARVVIKYLPGDRVSLMLNDAAVSPLSFDGTRLDASKTIAIGGWRGLDLNTGANKLVARISDQSGNVVATLERTIHYTSEVARAEFVPEKSILVADGIRNPVIAVRMVDRDGRPVHQGMVGEFSLSPPYATAAQVRLQQSRQLAGQEALKPGWQVQGDDGIAYIELAPTSAAGSVVLGFDFRAGPSGTVHQEIETWLKMVPREWIVVGFAKGSLGFETLDRNMQALAPDEDGSGVHADGRISLFAKGRVLGKWMLTLAYDSDKQTLGADRRGLFSAIDPQQYYTLYGDGTAQGYDGSSAGKLYLKLERDQFYALFGDFQTGLDRNVLSRYQRTLSGIKVEYRGPLFEINGFAARTSQYYARDEIPGDGTSGLYRLTHAGLLMNTERVRIETRDRYHSERILESRELLRHVDYDIDYDNGTLFFREPIASRDFDFNPNMIVVEYETRGSTQEYLTAGGRAGVRLMDGRLEAGVSYVEEDNASGAMQLAGVDARFRLTPDDQLRGEYAGSRNNGAADAAFGSAWLLEWQHTGLRTSFLAYARRNGPGFGLGQQNRTESGTFKTGIQGQYRIDERFALKGEVARLENLSSGAVRDAGRVELGYRAGGWQATVGAQIARDEALDGTVRESRQGTLGATRTLFDGKLALSAKLDLSLGGKNDSVDYPTRLQLGAAYEINQAFRIIGAQEFTDGEDLDTSTTRVGFEATPWANARLTSTLNQSQISEYGPRTFALLGLAQKFLVGERWSLDVAVDSSHAFHRSANAPLVVDPSHPIAPGGIRDGGALTEDFMAVSAGATYRAPLWTWDARVEGRQGDTERYGITTGFLRQPKDGVAISASLQAFSQHSANGSTGLLANARLSFAYRPPESDWSMLDKLEFRLDQVSGGFGDSIFGLDTLAPVGNARSRRLINNFVLNRSSQAWRGGEGGRNVLDLDQRSELSLYYGSKYVLDSFGPDDYAGYTDIVGAEWRLDIGTRMDVGLRASVIHSWSQGNFAWAIGPSLGFSPFTNAWVSVGYNIRGFDDRDFEDAHHTARGPYLVLRMKFDQDSLGLAAAEGGGK